MTIGHWCYNGKVTKCVEEPDPPRVENTEPQRVAPGITATYPRVGTIKRFAPTIPYSCTIKYMDQ